MQLAALAIAVLVAISSATRARISSEEEAHTWLQHHAANPDELAELATENPVAYGIVKALLTKKSLGLLNQHGAPATAAPQDEQEPAAEPSEPYPEVSHAHHEFLNWHPSNSQNDEAMVASVLGAVSNLRGLPKQAPKIEEESAAAPVAVVVPATISEEEAEQRNALSWRSDSPTAWVAPPEQVEQHHHMAHFWDAAAPAVAIQPEPEVQPAPEPVTEASSVDVAPDAAPAQQLAGGALDSSVTKMLDMVADMAPDAKGREEILRRRDRLAQPIADSSVFSNPLGNKQKAQLLATASRMSEEEKQERHVLQWHEIGTTLSDVAVTPAPAIPRFSAELRQPVQSQPVQKKAGGWDFLTKFQMN